MNRTAYQALETMESEDKPGLAQDRLTLRIDELFRDRERDHQARIDLLFAKLLPLQWVAMVSLALLVSPQAWIQNGPHSESHWQAALFLGGVVCLLPAWRAWWHPGTPFTRLAVTVGQMITSALVIHLLAGRPESHFHVLASLVALSLYRDWKVLAVATGMTITDHVLRDIWWPQSLFGSSAPNPGQWLEHLGWIAILDAFLFFWIRQGVQESQATAVAQASLEQLRKDIGNQAEDRTRRLQEEINERGLVEQKLRSSLRSLAAINAVLDRAYLIAITDKAGTITHANDNFCRLSGYSREELIGQNHRILKSGEHPESFFKQLWKTIANGQVWRGEIRNRAKDGRNYWVDTAIGPMFNEDGSTQGYLAIRIEITERVRLTRQLVESSRKAGMAEVATGVLHNVGNVLNSVNVSCRLLTARLRRSRVSGLQKVTTLLRQHESDLSEFLSADEHGEKLTRYLEELAEQLMEDREAMSEEIASLAKNIDHIKEIVARQQSYARIARTPEIIQPVELMSDALEMNAHELAENSIEVLRESEDVPPLIADKQKVLQILVNFIRNAMHACVASDRIDRRIRLQIRRHEGWVQMLVKDNGIGIPADNMTRIFSHGFTTRRDGHGFGLHAGANAAKEMGARLTVQSDGPGLGATFGLELPIDPGQRRASATSHEQAP